MQKAWVVVGVIAAFVGGVMVGNGLTRALVDAREDEKAAVSWGYVARGDDWATAVNATREWFPGFYLLPCHVVASLPVNPQLLTQQATATTLSFRGEYRIGVPCNATLSIEGK